MNRGSYPQVFCKEIVARNYAKLTVKQLCQSLFFNKVARLRPASLLKKRLWHRCFSVNFVKFLRTLFFIELLWWLLLNELFYISFFHDRRSGLVLLLYIFINVSKLRIKISVACLLRVWNKSSIFNISLKKLNILVHASS